MCYNKAVTAQISLCVFFLLYHLGYIPSIAVSVNKVFQPYINKQLRPNLRIPAKVWYKLGPKGLSRSTRGWTKSCIRQNPDYEVNFMTDDACDRFVRNHFVESHPELVKMYLGFTIPIFKADLFRYLALYHEGGIWLDLDTSCEGVPMSEWIPAEYENSTKVAVGWEFDIGQSSHFSRQFTSWTLMAAPGSPHFWQVIEDIMQSVREIKANNNLTSTADISLDMIGDVIDFTGPKRLTRSIYKSVENTWGASINHTTISNILKPVLIQDVLLFPGYAFADSSNKYSEEEKPLLGQKLVTHHYAGSWKNKNGGETL